jgi:glycogen operon protein
MLLAGDEFGRTQRGNNNAYAQDNDISWLDWTLHDSGPGRSLVQFVQKLCDVRSRYPVLRRNLFLTGTVDEELEIKDLTWINATGNEMTADEWANVEMKCFGMLMDGRARPTGVPQRGTEAAMLMVLNSHYDLVEFHLPRYPDGNRWELLIDTNLTDAKPEFSGKSGDVYGVTSRSLVLFSRVN